MKKQFVAFISLVVAMTIGIVGIIVYYEKSGRGLPEFPMLRVTDYAGENKSFQIYMANDGNELISSNPWSADAELERLPVFLNLNYTEVSEEVPEETEDEADDVAESASTPVYRSSYEEAEILGESLKESLEELIGMQNPQIDIYGGDYNVEQERRFYVALYEGSGDSVEQIVNYNMNRVEFTIDKDGQVLAEKKNILSTLEKVNDYPVISVEEAYELLENGNYVTAALFEMPGILYVADVKLIYRAAGYEEYIMPYYRFYVELPEVPGVGGMHSYVTYDVPAIDKKYISNMPKWRF